MGLAAHRIGTVLAAIAAGVVLGFTGPFGCDGAHFDEERIAAPAAYDEHGGEIVSHGNRANDERTIAALCPHGHVTGPSRSIVVAVQLVPHPIGESSPMARDRIPVNERRVSFTCDSPPVGPVPSANAPTAPTSPNTVPSSSDLNDGGLEAEASIAL